MERTVSYPEGTDIDDDAFRRSVRMECHLNGYEVIDFGYNGQEGQPYVTFRKKIKRKTSDPKERFF